MNVKANIVYLCYIYFFCQFDYFNALLVNTMDDEGNSIELGGEFPLEENEHFNKLSVNTLMSDIQVPTNVYNKGMVAIITNHGLCIWFKQDVKQCKNTLCYFAS